MRAEEAFAALERALDFDSDEDAIRDDRDAGLVAIEELRARLSGLQDTLADKDDLLLRLRDSALRGKGGTPDYWQGEIDAALAAHGDTQKGE